MHILTHEDPGFIILMGDSVDLGATHKWPGFGLDRQNLRDFDYNWLAKLFWLRMRKLYSALTPFISIFIVLGNHDGETQWNPMAAWGLTGGKIFFFAAGDDLF